MMDESAHVADSVQLGTTFRTITELTQAMVAAGRRLGISRETLCSPYVCMLVCPLERHCDAHLLGMYSQRDGLFHLRRCSPVHRCGVSGQRQALEHEVAKARYSRMRVGQAVEELQSRGYKVGYLDVHALLSGCREGDENAGNARKKADGAFAACLRCYEAEFRELNPGVATRTGDAEFFYRHADYSHHLRPVAELKAIERPEGFLVLGILYDPNNEPVVQSLLLTEAPKQAALRAFVAYDAADFYIVELDCEVIDTLRSLGVDFFVKTRDVCMYLEDQDTEEPVAYQRFLNCNYGDREYLKLEPRYYLRRYCKADMYGLNNMPPVSFDFVGPDVLALPFLDCLSALVCSIAEHMDARRQAVYETPELLLADRVSEYLEDTVRCASEGGAEPTAGDWTRACDLERCYCPCGKFQEFLIPCVHAVQKMCRLGIEPYLYVSSVYSRDKLLRLRPPVPVVSLPVGGGGQRAEPSSTSNENNSEMAIEV